MSAYNIGVTSCCCHRYKLITMHYNNTVLITLVAPSMYSCYITHLLHYISCMSGPAWLANNKRKGHSLKRWVKRFTILGKQILLLKNL